MSRTYHHGERRIRVRAIKKDRPDVRRIARALIELARADTEREAERTHKSASQLPPSKPTRPPEKGETGAGE